jgi:hypothetical protein
MPNSGKTHFSSSQGNLNIYGSPIISLAEQQAKINKMIDEQKKILWRKK